MTENSPSLDQTLRLVSEVIGAAVPSAQANFFDVGGDSLTAAFLSLLLEERLGASVDVFTIYAAENIMEIHDAVVAVLAVRQVAV